MTEQPFQALLELVRFDQDINGLTDQINQHKQEIETLHEQITAADTTREGAQKKVRDFKKLVDEQELVMKELGVAQKEKKHRLDTAANYKEMTALQGELAALHEQEAQAEQNLLDLWNKLENAQKESVAAEQTFAAIDQDLKTKITEHTESIAKLQQELEEKKAERAPLEAKVPDEWREKYSIMRARVPNPIVPVQNNMCSACFYTLTSQDIIRLRHRAILQCQSCYRLIYSPEAMAT